MFEVSRVAIHPHIGGRGSWKLGQVDDLARLKYDPVFSFHFGFYSLITWSLPCLELCKLGLAPTVRIPEKKTENDDTSSLWIFSVWVPSTAPS